MSRDQEIIQNTILVASHQNFAVLTVRQPYVLRLLGTSCGTNVSLYEETKEIILSLRGTKLGLVALSLAAEDKSFSAVGLFEVTSKDDGGVFVELRKDVTGKYRGDINKCGLDARAVFMGVESSYRVPREFWGDTKQADNREEAEKFVHETLGYHHRILRDGNAFCRFAVGDTEVDDLEAAHIEYEMERPGFRRIAAKDIVGFRQQHKADLEKIKTKDLECQAKQKEISDLKDRILEETRVLVDIKDILSKKTRGTWWTKLAKIRQVLVPLFEHRADVDLK